MFKLNRTLRGTIGAYRSIHTSGKQRPYEVSNKVLLAAGGLSAFLVGGVLLSQSIRTAENSPTLSTTEIMHEILNSTRKMEKFLEVNHKKKGTVDVVLGAQWGDEGKGKLVDIMSADYDVCARVAGGSNAGHTIVVNDKKYKFHLVPSGILNQRAHCVVGNGVVVHLRGLIDELRELTAAGVDYKDRLHLSDRAHIVFDFHQEIDGINEERLGRAKLGTTKKGIGPAYGSKINRNGIRIGDLRDMEFFEERLRLLAAHLEKNYPELKIDVEKELEYYKSIREEILSLTVDTVVYCNDAYKAGKRILIEGANATMLDIDFGTYPYVTSSNPSIGSVFTGLGLSAEKTGNVCGIVKAYCTRVGAGPFPTEETGPVGDELREKGGEFGTTTNRPRRCGWIDIPQLKYCAMVNGFTEVNLTKLDVLTGFEEVKIGVDYIHNGEVVTGMPASLKQYSDVKMRYETVPGWKEDISKVQSFDELPENCKLYVLRLEQLIGVPIRWIGVGPGRLDLIDRGEHSV
mmetsp:Transcript_20201/g.20301  ORF Transcript_20201/g.20301 Transcript_20201/m.20301 type:complete len:516 (-) Transcript_20201:177-1724(-)